MKNSSRIASYRQWFICAIALVVFLIPMLACENRLGTENSKESLGELAEQYWTKRWMEKDYEFTYKVEVEKDVLSFPDYLKRVKNFGQIKYLSVKTKEVKIDIDKGTVILTVKFRIDGIPKGLDQTFTDRWIYKKGQWLHQLPKKK